MISWYLIEDGYSERVQDPGENGISSHLHRFKNQVELNFKNVKITLMREDSMRNPAYTQGNAQRNAALDRLVETGNFNKTAPVYFADDDNSYDYRIFQKFTQIKPDKVVGVLPVGGAGAMNVEGPVCQDHEIRSWHRVEWHLLKASHKNKKTDRLLASDMAGFAIRAERFVSKKVRFSGRFRGLNEGEIFLKAVVELIDGIDLEWAVEKGFVGDDSDRKKIYSVVDCLTSDVLAWHTHTEPFKIKKLVPGYDARKR